MESRIIGNGYVRFGGGMPCYPSNREHASYPADIPGLALLDTPERALVLPLFGSVLTITVVRLFAWMPSWLEIMGVLFGADRTWQKVLVWTGLTDLGFNWYYYFTQAV